MCSWPSEKLKKIYEELLPAGHDLLPVNCRKQFCRRKFFEDRFSRTLVVGGGIIPQKQAHGEDFALCGEA
jgi:hypothetical protein